MSEKFRTKDIEVNYEQWSGKATIQWLLEIDMREWGVKDFIISVPDQTVLVGWTNFDDEDETPPPPPEELFLRDAKVTIDTAFYSLYPTKVSFYKGKWEVIF
jgi:hypothetical protein